MIADLLNREKRSFLVGVRRVPGPARFCFLVGCLCLPAFAGLAVAQSDGDEAGRSPAAEGGERPAMLLPWPDGPGDREQDGEAVDGASGRDDTDTDRLDPERLALWPVLRVGMVLDPARGDFSGIEPFRSHLENGLRLPVVIVAYSSLSRLQEAIMRGEIDYAPLSATAFVDAEARCSCLVPLAVPLTTDGVSGWTLLALLPEGDSRTGLEDLAQARIALGPETSTSTWRLPLALLAQAGIEPRGDRLVKTDTPLAAALAVIEGRADVAFGWAPASHGRAKIEDGTLAALVARTGIAPALKAVPVLGPVPNGPHVVRQELPETLRREIAELLTSPAEGTLSALAPGGMVAVGPPDFALLAPLVSAMRARAPARLRPLGGGSVR